MSFRKAAATALPGAYLLLCLVLGGSSAKDQLPHLWLQLISTILIAGVIYSATSPMRHRPAMIIVAALLAIAVWPILQLLPLPAGIWESLPGRDVIASDLLDLGISSLPNMPVSFSGQETSRAVLATLIPITFILLVAAFGNESGPQTISWGILICGATSALLGLLMVVPMSPLRALLSGLLPYDPAAGFFANANHQVTLLLMCLPLLAGMSGRRTAPNRSRQHVFFRQTILGALLILFLSAIWAAGVRASYILILPVSILSLCILHNSFSRRAAIGSLVLIVASVAGSILLAVNAPALEGVAFADFSITDKGRQEIVWPTSIEMLKDHWMFGTGLGTFSNVFMLYEDPNTVKSVWINHAHNEYLQVAIELGILGVLAMIVALAVYLKVTIKTWTESPDPDSPLRRAATVSCLVVLLHSLVDYPARTPAILVVLTACFILAVWPKGLATLAISRRPSSTRNRTARGIEI